jgi:hypothetical protein
MSQNIAALKNLKALCLFASDFKGTDMEAMASIKNLKHLYLEDRGNDYDSLVNKSAIAQSMLLNSTATLQSLIWEANEWCISIFENWETKAISTDAHSFTALKQFSISHVRIDEDFMTSIRKAIDFVQLSELKIGYLTDPECLLFNHLTSLAKYTQGTGASICLRSLSLKMSDDDYRYSPEQQRASLEAKCRLLVSFDTLTALELVDYGQYPKGVATNPGLPEMLLEGILNHKRLRTLKISYNGVRSNYRVPYLSSETVGNIIDGLPQLQELEFAPDENQIVSREDSALFQTKVVVSTLTNA